MKKSGKTLAIFLLCFFAGTALTGCERSAASYYEEGMEAFDNREYAQASECFSEALKRNQDKAEYYISYGLSLMKEEKYEQALEQLERAVLDKDNQIVLENNKAAYRGIGMVYYHMQEYGQAAEAFEQALGIKELSYVNRDLMSYLAECLEALGDYEQAASYYQKILDLEESAAAYAKKALLEKKSGNYEQSLKDYDQAISMEKENYDLYFQKYYLLKEQGKDAEAEKVLERAAAITPETRGQKYQQEKLYYFLGKTDAAQNGLETSLEEGYSEAGFYLGQIAQRKGKYKKAVDYYVDYIESGRKISSAAVYNQLGLCYMELEKYKYARDTFSIGMKLNDAELMQQLEFNRIIACEHLGDFEKAQKKAKEYLEKYPEDQKMEKELRFIKTRVK